MKEWKTKVITICGSSKFIQIMAVVGWFLESREHAIVMGLHLLPDWYTDATDHLAEHEGVAHDMDALHKRKIDISDEIFVVDWDAYIGSSTKSEIEYAKRQNKRIRYLTCEWELEDEISSYVDTYLMKHKGNDESE